MSFELFSDSSSNITPDLAFEWKVRMIPLHYTLNGTEHPACGVDFDGFAFYDALRRREPVSTSMVNTEQFTQAFEPVLAAGRDILYIGMSSGISGTVLAARSAAEELLNKYPERRLLVKDTLGASFGEGLFVKAASEMRRAGRKLEDIAAWIDEHIQSMNQIFIVDDLMYLKHGGRISGTIAVLGTLANIKPLLWGDTEGRIAMIDRMIGRKKSIRTLADRFAARVVDPESQTIAISHGDCANDAHSLSELIRKKFPKQDILIRCHEPGTGSHLGPGALALYFFGKPR